MKTLIAKFVGTAGELHAECEKVLGEKKLEVECQCSENTLMSVDEMITNLEETGKVFPNE